MLRPLHKFAVAIQRRRLRDLIIRLHGSTQDPEIAPIIDYLRRHPEITVPLDARPPYDFADQFSPESITVEFDDRERHPFVLVNGDRIYFPPEYSHDEIRLRVSIALMEQHPDSPHLYVDGRCQFGPDANAVLAGASDGIFALSIRDRLRKAYLFEPNSAWHKP